MGLLSNIIMKGVSTAATKSIIKTVGKTTIDVIDAAGDTTVDIICATQKNL